MSAGQVPCSQTPQMAALTSVLPAHRTNLVRNANWQRAVQARERGGRRLPSFMNGSARSAPAASYGERRQSWRGAQGRGMRAAWLTDIHLEFLDNESRRQFLHSVGQLDVDAFLIGGDITTATSLVETLLELDRVLSRPIYFVLGNHDFYGGSIVEVRQRVAGAHSRTPNLAWLSRSGAVALTDKTALVGHDSWADGTLGDYWGSTVELNDFYQIREFHRLDRAMRLQRMRALSHEAVAHFARVLPQALNSHESVICLTHVPPFREACWHEGRVSGDAWLPFFSSGEVGAFLKATMAEQPERSLMVLCGHTHGAGQCDILPNLIVRTGGAVYSAPMVQGVIDLA